MKEVVELNISSFRGAIGAEHYYGTLHVRRKAERVIRSDGSEGRLTRGGYGVESHPHDGQKVERKIGPREVAYLNKKDFGDDAPRLGVYKSGDSTERFNDAGSIQAKAIALFPTLFDESDLLVIEERRHSGVYRPLLGPPEIVEYLNAHTDYSQQHEFLEAHGYLINDRLSASCESNATPGPLA